jgi:hypothetical protein
MKRFRRLAIASINAVILGWILKVFLFDGTSDSVGIFFIISIVFLIVYNLYNMLVYNLFPGTSRRILFVELLYVFFSIAADIPAVVLYIVGRTRAPH